MGCYRVTRVEIDGSSAYKRVCDHCGTTSTDSTQRMEVGR
jgi:hypothetical protein